MPLLADPFAGRPAEIAALVGESNRRANQQSWAQMDAAMNLLSKAVTARLGGDEPRATRFVDRVAAMPWDEHEESSPGVRGACQLLYEAVSDELEGTEGLEDDWWLDWAVAALSRSTGAGREELASTLHGFVLQEDLFDLSAGEHRRITALVGDAPLEADLGDDALMTTEARREVIESILATLMLLEQTWQ